MLRHTLAAVAFLLLTSCGTPDNTGNTGTGESVQKSIGTEGGTLALEGTTIEFPAGALSETANIQVTSTTTSAGNGYSNVTPVYRFEPEGLVLKVPAKVKFTVPSTVTGEVAFYWSRLGAAGYDVLASTRSGNEVTASVVHFSTGFLGEGQGTSDARDAGKEEPSGASEDGGTHDRLDSGHPEPEMKDGGAPESDSHDAGHDQMSDGGDDHPHDPGEPDGGKGEQEDGGGDDGHMPPAPEFHLYGARLTGSNAQLDELDPLTGTATSAGTFTGVYSWNHQARISRDSTQAYIVGYLSSDATRLFSLDLGSGQSSNSASVQNSVLGGTTEDGQLIVALWNGSQENVSLLDPVSGNSTSVGTLGDLFGWQNQLAYDPPSHTLYAIGQDQASVMSPNGTYSLYSLDLTTGMSNKIGVDASYILGGIRGDGAVIGCDPLSQHVVAIDPATGSATDLGMLDFASWMQDLVWDPVHEKAYAFGSSSTMQSAPNLYWLDTIHHTNGHVSIGYEYAIGRY